MATRNIELGEVIAMASDPTKYVVIGEVTRPGVRLFITSLEMEVFPPDTALNEAFELVRVPWQSALFWLVLIPRQDYILRQVAAIATRCGLVVQDAIPMLCTLRRGNVETEILGASRPGRPNVKLLGHYGPLKWFPVRGENCVTLENKPGSKLYTPQEEEVLAKAAYWEWEEKHGKYAAAEGERVA